MSNLSDEAIDKIVENIINGKPLNVFEGINENDFAKIQHKLMEKGWMPK